MTTVRWAAVGLVTLALACSSGNGGPAACHFTSIGPLTNAALGVTQGGSVWVWGMLSAVGAGNPGVPPTLYRASTTIESIQSRTDTVCERYRDGSQVCAGASLLEELSAAATLAVSTSPPPLFGSRSCLVRADSTLECWDFHSRDRPVDPPALAAAPTSLALGDTALEEGCAVLQDHSVWCWGGGILGDGAAPRDQPAAPTEIEPLRGRGQAIAASSSGKCALTMAGEVLCWGTLLDPSSPALVPTAVDVGAPATAVVMGDGHACALTDKGHVVCWGDDSLGQTSARDGARAPVQVPLAGTPAVELAAGSRHSCARHADGTVSCWGSNKHGQLGQEGLTADSSPDPVPILGCPAD